MSINTDNDGISDRYIGNGITVNFPFNFKIFENTEIIVKKTSATGVITTLTFGTDYTVTLNVNQDNNPGGQITLPVALPTGNSLVIISNVSYTQKTVLTSQGNFDPQVLNDTHDKVVILTQQLKGKFATSLKIPDSDGTDINTVLPSAVNRAGKALVFQNDGSVGVSSSNYEDAAASAATSASQASASASQASTFSSQASASATLAVNSSNQASASATLAVNSANQASASANSLQWSGVINVGSNLTLNASHSGKMLVCNTNSGNIVLTLPEISTLTLPVVIGVKKKTGDANTITINTSGGNTIDSITSKVISVQGASVSLIPNASGDWAVIDASLPSSGGGQKSIYYLGTTTTVSNVWTVNNSDITSLYDGLTVQVKFDAISILINQLNINNLGAKSVRVGGSSGVISNFSSHLNTTNLFTLVYFNNSFYLESVNLVGAAPLHMDDIFTDSSTTSGGVNGVVNTKYNYVNITSTSGNITNINTLDQGTEVTLRLPANAVLVHSANFVLPNSTNITSSAGDEAVFRRVDSTKWVCVAYNTANGKTIGLNNVVNVDQTNANNITSGTVSASRLGSGTADSTKILCGNNTWINLATDPNTIGSVIMCCYRGATNLSTLGTTAASNLRILSGRLVNNGSYWGFEKGIFVYGSTTLTGTWKLLSESITAESTSNLDFGFFQKVA